MDAALYDLKLVQGATYHRTLRWLTNGVAEQLDPYTVKAQVRQQEAVTSPLLLDLTPHITVNLVTDTITLRVPATVTAALDPKKFRNAAWDLFLIDKVDPTEAFPLLQGAATCDPATTRTVGSP